MRRFFDKLVKVPRPKGAPARRRCRPTLEALEERMAPAVFHPLAAAPDGSPGSLRADVILANSNGHNNTILLQGATYNLTLANTAGQENAAAQGDLDLTDTGHTLTFIGRGAATVIDAHQLDRVFQVFPGVRVVFRNLTITGGLARDDGTAFAPVPEYSRGCHDGQNYSLRHGAGGSKIPQRWFGWIVPGEAFEDSRRAVSHSPGPRDRA